jgi:hypothetical protein
LFCIETSCVFLPLSPVPPETSFQRVVSQQPSRLLAGYLLLVPSLRAVSGETWPFSLILYSPQPTAEQATQAARRSVNCGVEVSIRLSCSHLSERPDIRTDVATRDNSLIRALKPRNGDYHVTHSIAEPA